jgi:hypothetical protein
MPWLLPCGISSSPSDRAPRVSDPMVRGNTEVVSAAESMWALVRRFRQNQGILTSHLVRDTPCILEVDTCPKSPV